MGNRWKNGSKTISIGGMTSVIKWTKAEKKVLRDFEREVREIMEQERKREEYAKKNRKKS